LPMNFPFLSCSGVSGVSTGARRLSSSFHDIVLRAENAESTDFASRTGALVEEIG
jgi:hypothetical protein